MTLLQNMIAPHPADQTQGTWFQEEARAERITNLIRIVYMTIWLGATIPTLHMHPFSSDVANVGVGTVWLLFGLSYQVYLRRRPYHPNQKYVATTVDILLNTAILFFYHFDMGYSTSLKAPPFMNFFLMTVLAAFRFNTWLPLYSGALSITLYGGLLGYLVATQDVAFGTPLELFTTPRINAVYQFYRVAYLAAFTFVTSMLVRNIHRLVRLRVTEAENALTERTRREQTQNLLERYFTPEIASYLAEHPAEMGGQMQEATVLVSDLRGFTTLSERLGPEQSVALLNRLFERLVDIIFAHGGTLDKFLGDGMLVVFGTPQPHPDDAERALRAARQMVAAVNAMGGEHDLRLGVAIHSGEVIFGNIGSPQRMELTVIGDAVNSASRIEALNKKHGTQIILSETTYQQLSDPPTVRPLPPETLRGKAEPLALYALNI